MIGEGMKLIKLSLRGLFVAMTTVALGLGSWIDRSPPARDLGQAAVDSCLFEMQASEFKKRAEYWERRLHRAEKKLADMEGELTSHPKQRSQAGRGADDVRRQKREFLKSRRPRRQERRSSRWPNSLYILLSPARNNGGLSSRLPPRLLTATSGRLATAFYHVQRILRCRHHRGSTRLRSS
jgi:hypothetical protein